MARFPLPDPMRRALDLARIAAEWGEVPVGAVIVKDGAIIAEGHNRPRESHDPTAHAEIVAIRAAAAKLGNERLDGCDLYVTLEPCAMCAGAIAHARIARLYYGADDAKGGAVAHGARVFSQQTVHHRPEIYDGIGAARRRCCSAISSPRAVEKRAEARAQTSSIRSTHVGTSRVAGPCRASANQWLPSLGSMLSSSVRAPDWRASRTKPAAG